MLGVNQKKKKRRDRLIGLSVGLLLLSIAIYVAVQFDFPREIHSYYERPFIADVSETDRILLNIEQTDYDWLNEIAKVSKTDALNLKRLSALRSYIGTCGLQSVEIENIQIKNNRMSAECRVSGYTKGTLSASVVGKGDNYTYQDTFYKAKIEPEISEYLKMKLLNIDARVCYVRVNCLDNNISSDISMEEYLGKSQAGEAEMAVTVYVLDETGSIPLDYRIMEESIQTVLKNLGINLARDTSCIFVINNQDELHRLQEDESAIPSAPTVTRKYVL